jgi:hypothetical protein
MPRGDFEFEDSVADSLRAEARDVVGEDLAESFQSGMYSENALVSTESLTLDQLAEWADFCRDRSCPVWSSQTRR